VEKTDDLDRQGKAYAAALQAGIVTPSQVRVCSVRVLCVCSPRVLCVCSPRVLCVRCVLFCACSVFCGHRIHVACVCQVKSLIAADGKRVRTLAAHSSTVLGDNLKYLTVRIACF